MLSQGVGRATALLFAQNGYNVVIAARNPEKLSATEAELGRASQRGNVPAAISSDITDESAVGKLVEQVTSMYENVNILINCAGECTVAADEHCTAAGKPAFFMISAFSSQCCI